MGNSLWWQKAVFYQIYPRSFSDGNGDGIGDLAGIISKLDYLQWLGVDAVWLSPHYPSPQVDCGYDISDYLNVAPEYGTSDQFRELLEGLHSRGMRLVLDLVLNHTSDQHPWFVESRSSKNNPKRDWYIWLPPRGANPPNDWYSTFGGPAWTLDELTGEYYYHFFFKEQPDLNWNNPQVKSAMFDVARYWCRMGVDGFRLDAVGTIYETPGFPDHGSQDTLDDIYRAYRLAESETERAAVTERWKHMFRHQHDLPEVHALMRELRAVIEEFPERVLIGETDEVSFYGNGQDELHLNFNFPLMHTKRIDAQWVCANQKTRLAQLPAGAWPCNTLGNHDAGRMISEFGDGLHDQEIARVNLALILTLWGTPFLYNGEEIGMVNHVDIPPACFKDPLCQDALNLEARLMGSSPDEALKYAHLRGRDKSRTPMQWSASPNGGFCPADVQPWLPVHPNHAQGINVEDQKKTTGSLLWFYRQMLTLRKSLPALQTGDFQLLDDTHTQALVFSRREEGQEVLVALNMTAQAVEYLPVRGVYQWIFSTHHLQGGSIQNSLRLQPFEVLIGLLETAD